MGLKKSKYIVNVNLNAVELQLLVKNTNFNEEELQAFYTSFIADCPSGCLTKKDFLRIFRLLHPDEVKYNKFEPYCNYVFR